MNVWKSDEKIRMKKLLDRVIDLTEANFNVLSKKMGRDSEAVKVLKQVRFEIHN